MALYSKARFFVYLGYQSGTPVLSIVVEMVGALICTKTGHVQAFNQTGKYT